MVGVVAKGVNRIPLSAGVLSRLSDTMYHAVVSDFDLMSCISPIALRLGRKVQFVPCGKCNFCLQSRRCDWSFRLMQELRHSKSAYFVTMTYNKVPVVGSVPTLCKSDVQLFTKRLRFLNTSLLVDRPWPSLRYYTVGEYGTESGRPHYHSIMFNLDKRAVVALPDTWGKGHCKIGSVTAASIHYVTKYVINRVGVYEGRQAPFSLISNRSGGLGIGYLEANRSWHKGDVLRNYVRSNGVEVRLPRFYKDKIFSAREKEELVKNTLSELIEDERKEILRLTEFHPDPMGYMYDRLVAAYDRIGKEDVKSDAL